MNHAPVVCTSLLSLVPDAIQAICSSSLLHFYQDGASQESPSAEQVFAQSAVVCRDLILANNDLTIEELTKIVHVASLAAIHP